MLRISGINFGQKEGENVDGSKLSTNTYAS
jgi:hypothetical protein